jgi:hypothetical protein
MQGFELAIETARAPVVADRKCNFGDEAILSGDLLKLTLKKLYSQKPITMVLQNDKKLPPRRNCAYNYTVQSVRAFADKLVVILWYWEPGFEGSDRHYMAVTTQMDVNEND